MSDSLSVLARDHRGKFSDKWSSYLSAYDRLLAGHKSRAVRLLEIGIQNGGSLELWAGYFSDATHLIGCDINPACGDLTFDDARISLVIGDVNDDVVQAEILTRCAQFDVIIDDGSHISGDIVKSFARYFGRLATDGLFIIEDLHCSYWQEFDGGLYLPHSSMAFLKQLTDVINHEHWGADVTRTAFLNEFAVRYGIDFDESLLAQIHSIEFMNSACVIRKAEPKENILGTRYIAGRDGEVWNCVAGITGSVSAPPDQSANIWSVPQKQDSNSTATVASDTGPIPAQHVIELFFDSGHGFTAFESVCQNVEGHANPVEFRFDLSTHPGLRAIRLDPLTDGVVLEIQQVRLIGENGDRDLLACLSTNGRVVSGNVHYFDVGDPQIYFEGIGAVELADARELVCRLCYLHTGRSAVHTTLHEFAADQSRKDAAHQAVIDSFQERLRLLQAQQPAFEEGLALLREEHTNLQAARAIELGERDQREAEQLQIFERSLQNMQRDHALAWDRHQEKFDLIHAGHITAQNELNSAHAAAIADLNQQRERREQELHAVHQQTLDQQKQAHVAAIAAFTQVSARQSADHTQVLQALKESYATAAALAEQQSTVCIDALTEQIARINVDHANDRANLLQRIDQLEQTIATVKKWRGYRFLERLQRTPRG